MMLSFSRTAWIVLILAAAITTAQDDPTEAADSLNGIGEGLLSGLSGMVDQGKGWLTGAAASQALSSIIPEDVSCPSLCLNEGATMDYPEQRVFESDLMGGTNITCQGLNDMLTNNGAMTATADPSICTQVMEQIANLSGLALQGMCGCLDAPPPPKICSPCGPGGEYIAMERPSMDASGAGTVGCGTLAWNAQFIINTERCDKLQENAKELGCCSDMATSTTAADESGPGGTGAVGGDRPPQVSPPVADEATSAPVDSGATDAPASTSGADSKTFMMAVASLVVAVAVGI